jgi:steroid delta-isomerase
MDGRVVYHRDYWDAAGELYERIPLLGALMRGVRRRLRAP